MLINAIWSDPHFGHSNIISYASRPFKDRDHMDEMLIANFNEVVGPDDVTVCLGDMFFCGEVKARQIMNRLNGKKILVRGNHDRGTPAMLSYGFDIVVDRMTILLAGKPCLLCHYPYAGAMHHGELVEHKPHIPERKKGELLIHGHTHSNVKVSNNMIHAGLDAWNWRPATLSQLEEIVKTL